LSVTNTRPGTSSSASRIDRRDFLRLLELAVLDADHDAYLQGLRSPFALLSAYDYVGRRQQLVVGPVEMRRQGTACLKLEVSDAPVTDFVEVARWTPLGPGSTTGALPDDDDVGEEKPSPETEPNP
jgi:hypothetical protein